MHVELELDQASAHAPQHQYWAESVKGKRSKQMRVIFSAASQT